MVSVFIELEEENRSGKLIGLVQWRTKRAPDHLRVGGCLQFSLNSKMRLRVVGFLTEYNGEKKSAGSSTGGVDCSFHLTQR